MNWDQALEQEQDQDQTPEQPLRCPTCGSTQITANKKGFGVGKAAVGGILLGPVGLAAGMLGSAGVRITCLMCGFSWKPGEKPHTPKQVAAAELPLPAKCCLAIVIIFAIILILMCSGASI